MQKNQIPPKQHNLTWYYVYKEKDSEFSTSNYSILSPQFLPWFVYRNTNFR